jgi:hypothetical protein
LDYQVHITDLNLLPQAPAAEVRNPAAAGAFASNAVITPCFPSSVMSATPFLGEAQNAADAPYGVLEHDPRDYGCLVFPAMLEILGAMVEESSAYW